MAERGKFWTAAETKLLIDTWSQDSTQKQLHEDKRNNNVFAQIVNTLAKRGYHRTAQIAKSRLVQTKIGLPSPVFPRLYSISTGISTPGHHPA